MRSVVLFSGGIDSAVACAMARAEGREVLALVVHYGQRHAIEIESARSLEKPLRVQIHEASISAPWIRAEDALRSYVPARNAMLLSLALGCAETLGADQVVIGCNAADATGYPDCRAGFLSAMQRAADAGLSKPVTIAAPLSNWSKAYVIRRGLELGVPLALTWSCYDPQRGLACGRCGACRLRLSAFDEISIPDPARYAP